MTAKDIWAVVPVKERSTAKQRLARLIPDGQRPVLALAMFEDVLESLTHARGLSGIIVITVDASATEIALRYGAKVRTADACAGHTKAVASAARALAQEGRGGMLQVPGDIPLVTADEISRLLEAHRSAPSFTIAPSHDDFGSNAILVSRPDAVPLTFGDDSFFPHLKVARQHGIEPTIVRLPGIARDIDQPEDIHEFIRLGSRTRTHEFLSRAGLIESFKALENPRASVRAV